MPIKGHKALKEKLVTLAVRLPESALQALEREIAHRLDEHPGIIISKSDLARDLILKGIRTFPSAAVPPSPPNEEDLFRFFEAPATGKEDQRPPREERTLTTPAPSQDREKTTEPAPAHVRSRTGRKRPAAAQG